MSYWDKKPFSYVILIASIGAVFLFAAGMNFVDIATSVTDENFYRPVDSVVCFKQDVIAERLYDSLEKNDGPRYDTAFVGNIIYSINKKFIFSFSSFREVLQDVEENEEMTVVVFEHRKMIQKTFKIRKSEFRIEYLRELTKAALVVYVIEGGASDRAGLRVGDYIVKVNGRAFEHAMEASNIMSAQKSGSIVSYEVMRDNDYLTVDVLLAKFGVKFHQLTLFISGVLMIGIGLFFGIKRPKLKAARFTGLTLLILGLIISYAILENYSELNPYVYIRRVVAIAGFTLGFPLLIHSLCYFPHENTELLKRPWTRTGMYIFGALAFIYSLASTFAWTEIRLWFFFETLPIVYTLYFVILSLIYRKKYSIQYKKSGRPLAIAYLINAAIWAFLFFHKYAQINIIGHGLAEYMFAPTLLIPLSYLYTAGRYRLLDLNVRVRRNIQYSLASFIFKCALLAAFCLSIWGLTCIDISIPNIHVSGASIEALESPLDPEFHKIYEKILVIVLSLSFGLILLYINKKGQRALDRKFHRMKFDFRIASFGLSEIMDVKLSASGLASEIVEKLGELIQLKRVGVIFFKDESGVAVQDYKGFKDASLREFCSFAGRELVNGIKQFKGGVRVDYLPGNIKIAFEECKFQYVIPIRSRGKVVGALLIGEKLSEAPIHDRDLAFLGALASQASAAVENAFLYEDLAQQERIKHELKIARRIQLASLPQDIPEIKGLDISGVSLPALEVGGDFYDILNGDPHRVTIIVGDVSGKGTSAALYMSKAQGIIRTLHEFIITPRDLFVHTNQLLYKRMERSSFITAIGALIDVKKRMMKLARAGHIPMYYYRKRDGKVQSVIPKGVVLGMIRDEEFDSKLEEIELAFEPGDVFLFVTDGTLEARNSSNDEFGDERLIAVFKDSAGMDSKSIREHIVQSVQEFAGDVEQFDDLTVVVVKAS